MQANQLRDLADNLFGKKQVLNSLHQTICAHFYPERADFTQKRSLGNEFADDLYTSYPILCRRELGNQFGTMLRPTARPWFHPKRKYEDKESGDVQAYLEYFERTMRKAMFDQDSLFTRATKEGDHDYAALGQCVISVEMNRLRNGMLYRCWHMRDMVWQENEEGKIGFVARKWKPTAQTLCRTFKDKVDQKVRDLEAKTPFEEVEVLHIVCEAEMYDDNPRGRPRFSIYYDTTNNVLIEATPIWGKFYVIPRWQTVSGSQYSYSPATVCALPDGRLIQAMTFTLLEAGEKAVRPPIIATHKAIRSDLALYAGGVTWVEEDYDEKRGASLRPLEQDFRGFNYGLEMAQDTRGMLTRAFFLDTLKLPVQTKEMTAYEVGQRVQEYIRSALPIFEPTEMEYNAPLCEETFELMWRNGGFGPVQNWPKELRSQDGMMWGASDEISFSFESPLHDVIEQQKGHVFQESSQLIASAIALDPSCAYVPKAEVMLRDTLRAIQAPAEWVNNEADVETAKKQAALQQKAQQQLAALGQASEIAKNLGAGNATVPATMA